MSVQTLQVQSLRRPVAWGRTTISGKVCLSIVAVALLTALFQLVALGANPWVCILAVGAVIVAVTPVWAYGVGASVGVFFLFVCCYWGLNALVVKSFLLQPLESHLYAPVLSHLIVFMAITGASLGAILVRPLLQLAPRIRWPASTPEFLRLVSIAGLVFTAIGWGVRLLGSIGEALSVFLVSYAILSFCAECARALVISKGRRHLSAPMLIIGAALVLLSLASNSKFAIMALPLAYVITVLAFGGRFKPSHAVIGLVGACVVSSVVFPAITFIARGDRDRVSATQLVSNTAVAMGQLAAGDETTRRLLEMREARNIRSGQTGYDVPYTREIPLVFERFILVAYVDAIARRLSLSGPFAGTDFVTRQSANVLPRFLNKNKVEEYSGNQIAIALRLADPGFAGFPTMGWPAETFYAGGLWFSLGSSIIVFAVFSLLLSCTMGTVAGNIFAIFITVRYFHLLACGVFSNYAFFSIRQLPFDIIIFLLIVYVARRYGYDRSSNVKSVGG